MSQSLSRILIHLVFSTRHREPTVLESNRGRLHAYMTTTIGDLGCVPLQVGGTADHVHLLFALARTATVAKVVERTKTASSRWMKERGVRGFAWQAGYGAFSVSESNAPRVAAYVRSQPEHHRRRTFEDEMRILFARHGVGFDERHVWD